MSPSPKTWILWALAGLLALGLGTALVFLGTDLPTRLINRVVDRYVEDSLGADVHIGDVGGDLLGSFALEDIAVQARNGRFRGHIAAISLHYDWRQLARRRWQFRKIDLQAPVLYLAPAEEAAPVDTAASWWPPTLRLPAVPDLQVDELCIFSGRLEDVHGPKLDSLGLCLALRAQGGRMSLSLPRAHLRLARQELRLRLAHALLTLSPDTIEVLQLEAQTDRSRLELVGRLALRPAFCCSLQVMADSLWLGDAGQILNRHDIPPGQVKANIQARGDSSIWRGHLELGGQAGRQRLDHLATAFRWHGQELELDQLSAQAPGLDLEGGGQLRAGPAGTEFTAHWFLRKVNLGAILPRAPQSRLSGQVLARGRGRSLETLQVEADLDLQPGMVAGRDFESLRGQVIFQQGVVVIPAGLEMRVAGGRLVLAGTMNAGKEVDAWAQVEVSDIGRLLGRSGTSGALQAQVKAVGSVRDPQVAGQIELHDLAGDGHRLGSARGSFGLDGVVSREAGFFALRFFDLRVGKLLVDQGGVMGRFAGQMLFLDEAVLETSDGNLVVKGQIEQKEGGWQARVDSLRGVYLGLTLANLTPMDLLYREGQMRLEESRLALAGGTIVAEGSVGPQSSLGGQLQLQDVASEQLGIVLAPGHQLAGRISADLNLGGSVKEPEFQAEFAWRDGHYDQVSFAILHGEASYAQRLLVLEKVLLEREDARFSCQGFLPLQLTQGKLLSDAPWDLALSGEGSSLGLLSWWVPDIERLEGPFTVQLRATGTPHQPQYDGHFDLQDARLKLAPLGNTVQRLSAGMHLDGQYLVIDHLRGETPLRERNILRKMWTWLFPSRRRGRFEGYGRINLADLAFDVTAKGKRVYLDYLQEQVEAESDFNIRATGTKRPFLSGQVTVLRALISRPMASGPRVASPATVPPYDLDLTVQVPKNCWVRNEAAEIELRGQMRVLQQEGKLSLLGNLETIRGNYFFYGNSFHIDRGLVTFDNLESVDPQLDIAAWTDVDRERIELTIGGRMKSPTISLSSSSGYGEGDIISLLTLHQSSVGLDTLGTQEVVAQQAESVFGSYLQEAFNRKASRFLGLEEFRLLPDPERRLDLSQAQLTVGTYLSSRMYVEYSRRLSLESGEQVGVEYTLSRYLSLAGHRDHEGLYRLGFSLKWDY